MKKTASYLSMENLDINEEENDEGDESQESDNEEGKRASKFLDVGNGLSAAVTNSNSGPLEFENVSIDPTFILNKGF